MHIQARPIHYKTAYYLINTDQVAFVWDSIDGLVVEFSSGREVEFQNLSVKKYEAILRFYDANSIVKIDCYPKDGIDD